MWGSLGVIFRGVIESPFVSESVSDFSNIAFMCKVCACVYVCSILIPRAALHCTDGASSFPLYLFISSSLSTEAGGKQG